MINKKIGLVNYGSGNYLSVFNAIKYLNFEIKEIFNSQDFNEVEHIILPGVGSYGNCINKLKAMNLIESLLENIIIKQKYFLGICVGMQVLSTLGQEFETNNGLNIIKGLTQKLETSKLKIPHMGWSEVKFNKYSEIFEDIDDNSSFYFLHSFYLNPEDKNFITSSVNYDQLVTSSIQYKNIYGVQFHPEKSQKNGLKLLKNFCNLK